MEDFARNHSTDSTSPLCYLSLDTNHIFFLGPLSLYQIFKYRLDVLGWQFHSVQSYNTAGLV